jgi:phosphotriesterase-related protein
VGLDQLAILREEGVDPRRVIIGHCQAWPYHDYHVALARQGAYCSFDRLGVTLPWEHQAMRRCIADLVRAGLTAQVLLSQDVCWRSDYVAYGGRGYAWVATGLREELAAVGVDEEAYHRMTVENPRRALTGEG